MNNLSAPVFIVGGSRTGSEMLKTMLSASPDLDFVDELFLLCPRWLHKDLNSNIRRHVGKLDAPGARDRMVDLLYSGTPYGWFYSVGIQELDREALREALGSKALTLKAVFDALMEVHARTREKSGLGAKFPTHYSRTEKLLEWYPDCRLIHTTRNPKAVYASQAAKYIREDSSAAARHFMRFRQFVHINIQTTWTSRLHARYRHLPNYRLVRYEDVVLKPEETLKDLCAFLGVEFMPEMLRPHQYGSSFEKIGSGTGIDRSSLDRWKTSLRPFTIKAIDLLHPKADRLLGY